MCGYLEGDMHFVFDARTCTPHFPGIGRYARALVAAMAQQLGEDWLTVLTSRACELDDRLGDADGVSLRRVPYEARSLVGLWEIPRLLNGVSADLYHSPYLLAPMPARVCSVVTLHDLIPLTHAECSTARARWFYRVWGLRALRRADAVVAGSHYALKQGMAVAGLDAGHIRVIHHGVDSLFCARPGDMSSQGPYLLYVGSDRPHKGLDLLLTALRSAPALPKLKIVGMQSHRGERRDEADALGVSDRIEWLGAVDDEQLAALYRGATAMVLPSRVEGFGLPVLEAMACGAPVVVSGIEPLLEVGGEAVQFFAPGDAEGLQQVLMSVCGDEALRRVMREQSLQRASVFKWEQAAAATLALYREIIREKRCD